MKTVESVAKRDEQSPQALHRARFELLTNLSTVLEPLMMVLGVLFLFLMLTWYAELPIEPVEEEHIDEALQVIWLIFVADFLMRFFIATVRSQYLRRNWLIGLSLAVPFIRPLQVFQVVQALHGLTLIAFLGAANRSLRALRTITRGRVFLYMIVVTVGVILAGGVGVHYFDSSNADSPVATLSESMWWSATLVTTLTHEVDVISTEARLIAFGLRLYGLNVFCFFMASIASYLIGVDGSFARMKDEPTVDPLEEEIRMLRGELSELRTLIARTSTGTSADRVDQNPR